MGNSSRTLGNKRSPVRKKTNDVYEKRSKYSVGRYNVIKTLREVQTYLLAVGLFFSFITVVPSLHNSFAFPKLISLYLAGFTTIGIEGVIFFFRKNEYKFTLYDALLALLLATNLLSFSVSFNQTVSFWGEYLEEGANIFAISCYLSIAWVYVRLNEYEQLIIKLFILAATTFESLYAIYQYTRLFDRPNGLEGQPIFSAISISLGLVILLSLYNRLPYKKILITSFGIIHLLALIALDSSTSFVSIAAVGIFLLSTSINHFFHRTIYKAIVILLLVSLVAITFISLIQKESFSLSQRSREINTAVSMIFSESRSIKFILLGHGQYAASSYFPLYKDPKQNLIKNEWDWKIVRLHNQYLDWFFNVGLFGFVPWIFLSFYYLKKKLFHNISSTATCIFFIVLGSLYFFPPTTYVTLLIYIGEFFNDSIPISMRALRHLWILFLLLAMFGLYSTYTIVRGQIAFTRNDFNSAYIYDKYNSDYMYRAAVSVSTGITTYGIQKACPTYIACDRSKLQRDFTSALTYINRAVDIQKKAEYFNEKGEVYFYQLLYDDPNNFNYRQQALENFQKAITYDPQNPIYVDNVGQIYLQYKNFPKAEYYFSKALALKKDYIVALKHLREIYKQTGDNKKSMSIEDRINIVEKSN